MHSSARITGLLASLLTVNTLASPPVGFVRTPVATGLSEPTCIAFLPDGRMLIGERAGRIRMLQNGQLLGQQVLQLPSVYLDGDVGLLGIAVDPLFTSNGSFYVFWSFNSGTGPRSRVARFTMSGNTAPVNTLFQVWLHPQLCIGSSHHGGSIAFLPDGTLLIPTGDQFNSDNSQDMTTQHGKILRLNSNGTVPADNPFIGQPGVPPAVWAVGVRNPFRSAVDPASGRFYIGDVGLNTWEEIDLIARGNNLGWPLVEGPACYVPDCTPYTPPIIAYSHDDPAYGSNVGESDSGAVVLGCVYRGTAFPAEYRGNLFFADYTNGWIRRAPLNAQGFPTSEHVFDSAPDAGSVVDLREGPDGALYAVNIFGGPYGPSAYKIAYSPGGNLPPTAVATASALAGQPPLTVSFDGSASVDPDDAPSPLAYSWDFGDGGSSTQVSPARTFTSRGYYEVRLTVSDGAIQSAPAVLRVAVGTPPVPTINQPATGFTYRANQTVSFSATATDSEDGTLPASAFSWYVFFKHGEHLHPFIGPLNGTRSGSFTVPDYGHPPEHTSYLIRLTVTDSDGIPTSASRIVLPEVSELVFDSVPANIPVFIDTGPQATPSTYESLVNFRHVLSAQPSFILANRRYTFSRWNTTTERSFPLVSPVGGASFVARYSLDCPGDWDGDGRHLPNDLALFVNQWVASLAAGTRDADYDGDRLITPADVAAIVQDWLLRVSTGC